MWGAIIAGAAGAAGGLIKNAAARKEADRIMKGTRKLKDGSPRMYGEQQDELIRALAAGRADQSLAESQVARSGLGRQLSGAAAGGDTLGARNAMLSGEEAQLAGGVGRAVGQESVGNMAGASTNISQAANDVLNRERIRLDALRMYMDAKNSKKSNWEAAGVGAANGLMAGMGT
jgi:hypothetical protein